MPKRLRKKPSGDPAQSAFKAVQRVIELTETAFRPENVTPVPRRRKNAAAVALGRKGGKKSAAGRMAKITPAERRRIAGKAAKARWAKKPR